MNVTKLKGEHPLQRENKYKPPSQVHNMERSSHRHTRQIQNLSKMKRGNWSNELPFDLLIHNPCKKIVDTSCLFKFMQEQLLSLGTSSVIHQA